MRKLSDIPGDFRTYYLDRPVHIPGTLTLIDCKQGKPQRISITNTYMHEGLNCGINVKGANEILVANSIVERTRMAGVTLAEDHWWSEGGMAGGRLRLFNLGFNVDV